MGERVHGHLKAWDEANGCPQRGLWSPVGHSSQAVPWDPPASLLTPKQERWQALTEKAGSNSYLTLHLTTTTPTNCWLNGPLTVAC